MIVLPTEPLAPIRWQCSVCDDEASSATGGVGKNAVTGRNRCIQAGRLPMLSVWPRSDTSQLPQPDAQPPHNSVDAARCRRLDPLIERCEPVAQLDTYVPEVQLKF